MNRKNLTTYRARFTGLKLNAFGFDQVVDFGDEIEVYQARANPELWKARPTFTRGGHTWEASSAEALMDIITRDFVGIVKPWRVWPGQMAQESRPSLTRGDSESQTKAG